MKHLGKLEDVLMPPPITIRAYEVSRTEVSFCAQLGGGDGVCATGDTLPEVLRNLAKRIEEVHISGTHQSMVREIIRRGAL